MYTQESPQTYIQEDWAEIDGFPDYLVSNLGRFMNHSTGHIMSLSKTRQGHLKVGLSRDRRQYVRLAKLLVANAFVPGRSYINDTPVLRDGDQDNLMASNIVWRERSFAWRYTHQFNEHYPYYDAGPLLEITEDRLYPSTAVAGIVNCELFEEIMFSCINGDRVWPHGHIYTYVKDTHVLTLAEKTRNIMR